MIEPTDPQLDDEEPVPVDLPDGEDAEATGEED